MGRNSKSEAMCPRFPELVPLDHPIPSLKDALEKVRVQMKRTRNCDISYMKPQRTFELTKV